MKKKSKYILLKSAVVNIDDLSYVAVNYDGISSMDIFLKRPDGYQIVRLMYSDTGERDMDFEKIVQKLIKIKAVI